MSTFLHRVQILIKSVLAVVFFTIFFCVTYLFRKTPAQYSRIRNEQVILLRQMKQKVSEWRLFSKEDVKCGPVAPTCLLKSEVRDTSPTKEPIDTKKAKKEHKKDPKKDKKRRDSKRKSVGSSKMHTLIISDPQGKTVEEVHFMDEDYQEVLEYMRSKKKKDASANGGVSKVPT